MDSKPTILIAGGSGMLGNYLVNYLSSHGNQVSILSRNKKSSGDQNVFEWNPNQQILDPLAFQNVHTVINLAGASISAKRWSKKRKQEILDSRIRSVELLVKGINDTQNQVKTFISVSATGIYGDTSDRLVNENSTPAKDFLGETCAEWENAVLRFVHPSIRVVVLRVGVVLTKKGGALPVFALPVKLFLGMPVGSGKQYLSWIHFDDLCKIFLNAIEKTSMQGIYNAVAPVPVTQDELIKTLSQVLRRPYWPFHIPAFLLQLILGEKANIALHGQRVTCERLLKTGFQFQFTELKSALQDIYK